MHTFLERTLQVVYLQSTGYQPYSLAIAVPKVSKLSIGLRRTVTAYDYKATMTTPTRTGWSVSSPDETNTITCVTDANTPSSGVEGSLVEGRVPQGNYHSAAPAVHAIMDGSVSADLPQVKKRAESSNSSLRSASTRKSERERILELARRRQALAQAELAKAQLAIADLEVEIARSASGQRSNARLSDVGSDPGVSPERDNYVENSLTVRAFEPLASLAEHPPPTATELARPDGYHRRNRLSASTRLTARRNRGRRHAGGLPTTPCSAACRSGGGQGTFPLRVPAATSCPCSCS